MRLEEVTEASIKQLHIRQSNTPHLRQHRYLEMAWYHSVIVGKIALQLADSYQQRTGIETDRQLIKRGVLVHNIGDYTCFDRKLDFSAADTIGSRILYKEGFPAELVAFPLINSNLSYRKNVLESLGILQDNDSAPPLEEMIVRYADNFHNGSARDPRFLGSKEAHRRMKDISRSAGRRFGVLRDEFGVPDLSGLRQEYQGWHKEMRDHYAGLLAGVGSSGK